MIKAHLSNTVFILNYFQVFSMLPGFSSELMPKGHEKESQAKIKRYMTMMDSMTDAGKLL
jgi:signal recognition particle GTPase